jgi:hypothetical protein
MELPTRDSTNLSISARLVPFLIISTFAEQSTGFHCGPAKILTGGHLIHGAHR